MRQITGEYDMNAKLRERMSHLICADHQTLPSLCLNLRMSLNGASEPISSGETAKALQFLKDVDAEWHETVYPEDIEIDAAVRQLVRATISYIETYLQEFSEIDGSCADYFRASLEGPFL